MNRLAQIDAVADEVVRRGAGFSALAIFCVMVGLSFEPAVCFQAGALMTSILAVVLVGRSHWAPTRPYKRTELWIALDKRLDLPDHQAQRIVGVAMREAYMRYAQLSGATAAAMWIVTGVLSVVS